MTNNISSLILNKFHLPKLNALITLTEYNLPQTTDRSQILQSMSVFKSVNKTPENNYTWRLSLTARGSTLDVRITDVKF